jgi:hypothetical protein
MTLRHTPHGFSNFSSLTPVGAELDHRQEQTKFTRKQCVAADDAGLLVNFGNFEHFFLANYFLFNNSPAKTSLHFIMLLPESKTQKREREREERFLYEE